MRLFEPTTRPRLNEALAIVYLFLGLFLLIGLGSYDPFDPSWNTASAHLKPQNLTGRFGAHVSDLLLQGFGLGAYALPLLIFLVGWYWVRSEPIPSPKVRFAGALMLMIATCTAFGFNPDWRPIAGVVPACGFVGGVVAEWLVSMMNLMGAAMVTGVCWILGLYLATSFEFAKFASWFAWPARFFAPLIAKWTVWRERRMEAARERAAQRAQMRKRDIAAFDNDVPNEIATAATNILDEHDPPIVDPLAPPFEVKSIKHAASLNDIPIRALEEPLPVSRIEEPVPAPVRSLRASSKKKHSAFRLPPTALLQEPAARSAFDTQELKDTAARIKSKFEEFNVRGTVTQINPGPVVTTFEFKPEAGVKYTRITALTEDLCLGLQAESILIERIPGKPTVGLEVPNTKREVISLRQILESEEFHASASPLTVALGKDINGRIKVTALDSMPHLLIAGSTGSGKSVMLNALIMSILYKATPDQVRLIMVDPKRLEFGLYEGIPHLLTPVITDAKKATNALRNAVLEMERRLKLLAALGVRNIDQYNKKVRQLAATPRSLFDENAEDELEPLPYILILIDELADLMMLERSAVEETVTRLAQMARAVGMHLVLATQRPSVDVITGLIKANFPSRISFRVATRVDSRTVLDVMGAEHLLGKGDMLFLPPGSSRLVRVHGSYVSEAETNDVVEFWKQQAEPEYDQSFLLAPPSDDDEMADELDGPEDPLYQDAVRVVLEMGKASTSTLQRRLRLGYGRAARILDMMQREGIIGPPDGSRPRDVLKRPDWLAEVEDQFK